MPILHLRMPEIVNYSEISRRKIQSNFPEVPLAFRLTVDSSAAAAFGGTAFKEPDDFVSMLNSTRRSGRSIRTSIQIHDGNVFWFGNCPKSDLDMEIVSNPEVGEDILNIQQAQQISHSRTMTKSQD